MNYTEKRLEEELSKLVIELVWSATDGGCKITESNFSHFEEPIPEWTALVSKFSESIHQAEQEMMKKVVGEIGKGRQSIVDKYDALGSALENNDYWFILKVFDDLLTSLQDTNPK